MAKAGWWLHGSRARRRRAARFDAGAAMRSPLDACCRCARRAVRSVQWCRPCISILGPAGDRVAWTRPAAAEALGESFVGPRGAGADRRKSYGAASQPPVSMDIERLSSRAQRCTKALIDTIIAYKP